MRTDGWLDTISPICKGRRINWRLPKSDEKFWEELIAYFTIIRHGPHRKRNNYVGTHRQQGDLIIYTRSSGNFYRAVA
jgi:hypothetical protein